MRKTFRFSINTHVRINSELFSIRVGNNEDIRRDIVEKRARTISIKLATPRRRGSEERVIVEGPRTISCSRF